MALFSTVLLLTEAVHPPPAVCCEGEVDSVKWTANGSSPGFWCFQMLYSAENYMGCAALQSCERNGHEIWLTCPDGYETDSRNVQHTGSTLAKTPKLQRWFHVVFPFGLVAISQVATQDCAEGCVPLRTHCRDEEVGDIVFLCGSEKRLVLVKNEWKNMKCALVRYIRGMAFRCL